MVNGLRKITWASVSSLPFESAAYTSIYVYMYMLPFQYIYTVQRMELMENSNFRLFAANGKRKWQTSVCFLQTENLSLFALGAKL
jgi:hypothetical protein